MGKDTECEARQTQWICNEHKLLLVYYICTKNDWTAMYNLSHDIPPPLLFEENYPDLKGNWSWYWERIFPGRARVIMGYNISSLASCPLDRILMTNWKFLLLWILLERNRQYNDNKYEILVSEWLMCHHWSSPLVVICMCLRHSSKHCKEIAVILFQIFSSLFTCHQ